MLKRLHDWDTHSFQDFILSRATTPFTPGSNDCATFAADGILAITGVDVMPDLRGYSTLAEGMQKIAAVTGGSSLLDAINWIADRHELIVRDNILFAQRGDLVLYHNGDDLACGLVHLTGRDIITPGKDGLLRVPLTSAFRVWTY